MGLGTHWRCVEHLRKGIQMGFHFLLCLPLFFFPPAVWVLVRSGAVSGFKGGLGVLNWKAGLYDAQFATLLPVPKPYVHEY